MFNRIFKSILAVGLFINISYAKEKPTLLFYCGITMVKPMKEIAKHIEKTQNCTIRFIQGGSKDLYQSLAFAKKGDIYLPGSSSYRINNLKSGFLLDSQYIGFNQAAIFVQKGNPKNIKDLSSLTDESISTTLCNPKSGSIGKETKSLLIKYQNEDFFYDAYDLTAVIGTDSRNLNTALINKDVDMAINWRATGFWDENSKHISVIDLDEKYATKKKLVLNLLSFSKHPKIVKEFMKYAASKDGQKIMKNYGFR